MRMVGQGGTDTANLVGTGSDDTYYVLVPYSYLIGGTIYQWVIGFGSFTIADSAGFDRAYVYGGTSSDNLT